MEVYWRNPMVYAGAVDLNLYVKRNFAPLTNRVASIIKIEQKVPALLSAARTNLQERLAQPLVETAIDVAKGAADFFRRDLPAALTNLASGPLRQSFQAANQRAIEEMDRYVTWLQKEKLPGAHQDYALGPEKFGRMLAEGELINRSPEEILAIGLKELAREQQVFAEAARIIDPARKASEDSTRSPLGGKPYSRNPAQPRFNSAVFDRSSYRHRAFGTSGGS